MKQIWFMPWAGLGEFTVGPVTFWPFPRMANERVGDHQLRRYFEKYFRRYVDHTGSPVDTVTVCSHRSTDLEELRPDDAAEVRAAVDAVIFSAISSATKAGVCADNRTIAPPSADRYQLLRQNLSANDDFISVTAGNARSICKVDDLTFQEPWCLGGGFGLPSRRLIAGFNDSFSLPQQDRERLFRSLEWFRLAHTHVRSLQSGHDGDCFRDLVGSGEVPQKEGVGRLQA